MALTSCGAGEVALNLWEYSIPRPFVRGLLPGLLVHAPTALVQLRATLHGRDALGTYAAGRSRSRLFFLL